jgi:hypothetical protein
MSLAVIIGGARKLRGRGYMLYYDNSIIVLFLIYLFLMTENKKRVQMAAI